MIAVGLGEETFLLGGRHRADAIAHSGSSAALTDKATVLPLMFLHVAFANLDGAARVFGS
ncbi:MAG: hypothetical protein INF88_12370 [Roseomonas sp.]|nr:hypothetical protein [Roseomonas sp.]